MSWWGGGDIRGTPGLEFLNLAIYMLTFFPGNCPPSPGFAPCAILISNWSAFAKNVGVTPNLPEATLSKWKIIYQITTVCHNSYVARDIGPVCYG